MRKTKSKPETAPQEKAGGDCPSASCVASFVRMFKPQFAPMIEAGTKLQTVRPTPKRMPKQGDRISLRCWEGKPYRSKQRILREATITRVDLCEITESNVFISWRLMDREPFALKDGFASWTDLREWFRATHGLPFVGVLISWHDAERRQCLKTKQDAPPLGGASC